MPNFISEDEIEKALLTKLKRDFGFELLNCHTSDAEDLNDKSGRKNKSEVVFAERQALKSTCTLNSLSNARDKGHAACPSGCAPCR